MSVIVSNRRSVGVNFSSRGESEVLVWAPYASSVAIVLSDSDKCITLHPEPRGYFSCITNQLKPGDRYFIELDGQTRWPDPASMLQPDGVSGPSEVFDPNAFNWTDTSWKNHALRDYIIYELHVGTFTASGNFSGIIDRLPYLKALGITAIELMPIAEFPGSRNWGYDGVFPFAAHHSYGGPRELQNMVNACHAHGIAVVLDVVYNHVGPEGNNLEKFGPYFTDKYRTPWGKAINFDDAGCDEVRKFFIENALMWLRDFHIDALRLDAVHAIRDFSATHVLQELRVLVNNLNEETYRAHYLIAECDLNDPKYLIDVSRHGYGMDAQWIDEFHHALRVAAGKDPVGYYADFHQFYSLGKAFSDAYVYDGQYSQHRQKTFGRQATGFSGEHFIVFSQNHDQVGNTMLGERTSKLAPFEMLKVLAGAVICSPYLPMLFMGEEYGAHEPFQYFISHQGKELVDAVREGRRNEFAAFFHQAEEVPDPQAEQTFLDCKLKWNNARNTEQEALLEYYKHVINVRKKSRVLSSCSRDNLSVSVLEPEKCLVVHRRLEGHQTISVFNFSEDDQRVELPSVQEVQCLINSGSAQWLGTDAVDVVYSTTLTVAPSRFLLFGTEHV
jgi:maltooligosyltrehalose trehalohydrolase